MNEDILNITVYIIRYQKQRMPFKADKTVDEDTI